MKKITFPITEEQLNDLKAGDRVLASGYLYTARDAAHKRMYELLCDGKSLPIDVDGQTIYYVGAAPAKPGYAVGPCGPTSSYRMDKYAPSLLDCGLKVMIGKGIRNDEVIESMKKNNAVYLIAIGGAAALIAKSITKSELVCYEDLGTEAIYRYEVKDMPLIVGIDSKGGNVYKR
ncbi:MAG: Fe-S-containing hydro-lyase [Acutalibacteraceae bacterium]|nr:Fe-S-containing hydro-lyase [Clostridia bacterium]MEE3450098.1 Fe-S-containing hydro-lyase [Acutalibacteraceae bacterium]